MVEEEKCVGNAEEAVDDALEADMSNMLCVQSSYAVGVLIHTVLGGRGGDDDRQMTVMMMTSIRR